MRTVSLASLACLFLAPLLLLPAVAAADRNKDVAASLRQRYPDAETEIMRTSEMNGVKVHHVEVRTKNGNSTALITDTGDFLISGEPGKFNQLPSDARAAQALFKSKPQDVEILRATSYWVDLDVSGKTYRVRLDPLGRVRGVANPKEYEAADVTQYERASKENRDDIVNLAKKHLEEPGNLQGLYRDPQLDGFFVAHFVKDGKHQLVFLDERDNLFAIRTEIDRKDLPKPVSDTIQSMFDAGKIKQAFRGEVEYAQWTQQNASGQPITFKVRPNGDIMEIRSAEAAREDEAITAAAKQGPQQREDRKRDRDDD